MNFGLLHYVRVAVKQSYGVPIVVYVNEVLLVKYCTTCNIEQPIDNFHKNKNKKDGHSYKCKSCTKLYHKRHYENNKKSYADQAKEYKEKSRDYVRDVKMSSKCSLCEEDRWFCLDFHHIDTNKEHNISDMVKNRYSIDRIKEEIKKCMIVCKNCHAEIHYNAGVAQLAER